MFFFYVFEVRLMHCCKFAGLVHSLIPQAWSSSDMVCTASSYDCVQPTDNTVLGPVGMN